VPLPFLFPFFPPFLFSCCKLFSLLWTFKSRHFLSQPPVAGHLRIPTASFSHCHLPHWCFRLDLILASLVDHLVFYFLILALFPIVFCFYLFSLLFGFGISLYCSFSVCFVCFIFAVMPISSASISPPPTYY
jgi:hypothetical protein